MRILLTNDDGIFAPGINALSEALSAVAEVFLVAPAAEQSGASQAITVHHPIRVDEYKMDNQSVKAWQVGGTPADCVKIGLAKLMDAAPDFVVSGINSGPNLGTDVLYSGTVSAAREGAMHGIPSVAISLDARRNPAFRQAALFMREFMPSLLTHKLNDNLLLNINVPGTWEMDKKMIQFTKLGVRQYENAFEERLDPSGRSYYWMGGVLSEVENAADTDVAAVKDGKLSITPLHFELTNQKLLNELAGLKFL